LSEKIHAAHPKRTAQAEKNLPSVGKDEKKLIVHVISKRMILISKHLEKIAQQIFAAVIIKHRQEIAFTNNADAHQEHPTQAN
jgi:transposase-like protein